MFRVLFLASATVSLAETSVPSVKTYSSTSQVANVAVAGGNTTTIKYLGDSGSASNCQKACLAMGDRCWSYTYFEASYQDKDFAGQCFGVSAPRFSPTPEDGATTGVVEWPCRDNADCSMNGQCSNGACKCDPAWSGLRCEQLNLVPAKRGAGYRGVDNGRNTSSWGGAVLKGEDGKYHMWAAEMTEHCGIGAWAQNSRIIRAVSDTPGGEYKRAQVVYEVFSHEPEVVRGPNGEYIMYFTANLRSQHGDCNCCRKGQSKCDGSTGPGDCPSTAQLGAKGPARLGDTDGSYMSYSMSPEGPWSEPQPLFPGYVGSDTNFAPAILANGSLVALWRTWESVRGSRQYLATGADWNDTAGYVQHKDELFPDLGPAGTEDQFLYVDKNGVFHSVFHHMYGYDSRYHWWLLALGGHAYSLDGKEWTYTGIAWGDPFDAKRGNVVEYDDGTTFRFTRRERPHLILDDEGNPTHLITAAQYGTGTDPGTTGDNGDASYTLVQEIKHN